MYQQFSINLKTKKKYEKISTKNFKLDTMRRQFLFFIVEY